ncbi:flagellin, partial [Clostridium septicum]
KELDQLRSEIDRISSQTQFNKMDVLNGDGDKSFKANIQVGANSNQAIEIAIDKMDYSSLFKAHKVTSAEEVKGDITVKATKDIKVTIDTKEITIKADKTDKTLTKEELVAEINKGIEAEATLKGKVSASFEGNKLTISRIDGEDKEVTVKVEDNNGAGNTKLGLDGDNKSKMEVFNVDLTSHAAATGSISAIDRAIEKVSTQRSQLGAYQNRLEHTIKNVDNAAENLQAAESRVRDVDMANEMMTFSKNNILTQAAQAMLAQANQQPQGVLQLLR